MGRVGNRCSVPIFSVQVTQVTRVNVGQRRTGTPAGIASTTETPRLRRLNAATTAVASRMPISGPGACGHRQCTSKRKASTAAANAIVAGWTPPMRWANEATRTVKA